MGILQEMCIRDRDEANLCMKAPQRNSDTAEQSTATADLSTISLEIVEYSEKAIAVFGDTRPIKEMCIRDRLYS